MVEEKKSPSVSDEATEDKQIEEKKEPVQNSPAENIKAGKVKVPDKFKNLVEEIEKMSVLDLAELVKILEKKFGVSAAAPVAAAPAGGTAPSPAEGGEAETAKAEVNIELKEVGEKKIEVIKAVRDVTEKGLKEAKDLVDAVASGPQMVKEAVKKEEAEEIKKKFETAGAKVELK